MGVARRQIFCLTLALAVCAACTPWGPGDTVHHFRPPREPPAPRRPAGAEAGGQAGLSAEDLESDMAALGNEPPDLTGTWAQVQVTGTLSNAPMVGEIRSTTTTLFRLEVTQTGDHYTVRAQVCDLDVESEGGMRTIIPDRFVAAIPTAEARGRVERFEGGYRVVQAPYTQVLGAQLDDPAEDPLPRDPDDPRVVDEDGDGEPGVTIRVEGFVGGDIYMVQRTTRSLEGVVRDPDTVNGHLEWSMAQVTLGASSFLLNVDTHARADPDPERNTFRSRRVAAETDCAGIAREREQLFGR